MILAQAPNELVTGGVVIISVMMVLKGIGELWTKVNPPKQGNPLDALHSKMSGQVDSLWKWHAPDQDGEQSWKNKRLSESMSDLSKALDRQTEMLRTVSQEMHDMKRVVAECPIKKGSSSDD